ncbi:MAG: radical SAM protein [Nitrospinae bacterium]|nr:radical SAM protein [Nitrospinota bacterium]
MTPKDELAKRGVEDGSHAFTGPYGIQVGLTGYCNYQCEFCFSFSHRRPENLPPAENHPQLSPESFNSLVREAAEMGVEQISIVGVGEPFLHPSIMDFICLVKSLGMRCMVTTNGSLLKPQVVERIIETGVDIINVSFNASSEKTYGFIHGSGSARFFNPIVDNLAYMKTLKEKLGAGAPKLSIRFVLSKTNLGEMGDWMDLALSLGAQELVVQKIAPPFFAPDLALGEEDEKTALSAIGKREEPLRKVVLKSNIGFIVKAFPWVAGGNDLTKYRDLLSGGFYKRYPCLVGWTYVMILEDGSVRPCCYCGTNMGNINSARFSEIWNGEIYHRFREKSIRLPQEPDGITGCVCHSGCGSVMENIRAMEKLDLKF